MDRQDRFQAAFKRIGRSVSAILLTWLVIIFLPTAGVCTDKEVQTNQVAPHGLALIESTMCEQIADGAPINSAVVFSIKVEKVICFTAFDPVPEDTFIYHNWFRKDKLSTQRKLSLKAPRWKTFSGIYLRESDIGPWRVEVTGPKGEILDILWFSITE